jgi:HPt (histidine-containing phosphotransfer) domain-containing protein
MSEANDPAPVNESEALERLNGDREFLNELLVDFVKMADEEMDKLRNALQGNDANIAVVSSHGMKGAAANLSANAFADEARRIEMLCRESRLQEAASNLDGLQKRLEELREYVSNLAG